MKRINVDLEYKPYQLMVGENSFDSILKEIEKLKLPDNLFVVVDKNVDKHHYDRIREVLNAKDKKIVFHNLKAEENSKNFNELYKIYDKLIDNNFSRDTLLIAIGGGLTGDICGFAASTYMRGIPFINVPTTLLSFLDSSVGGKNGINFAGRKNIIGTFYQPEVVIIDPEFITSLPKRDLISGIGEVMKYTLISNDYNFLFYINNNLNDILEKNTRKLLEITSRSVAIKSQIVIQDEKEKDIRKILNLGHTFGHAFESVSNFKVKHGEAIIAGLIASLYLSNAKGLLSTLKLDMFMKVLLKIKLPNDFKKLDKAIIYDLMKSDKKNREGRIKFVLLQDIGNVVIDMEAEKEEVFEAIDKTLETIYSKK